MNDHYKSSNISGGGGSRNHFSNTSGNNRYHYSNSSQDKRHTTSTTVAKGKTEWRKTAIRICGDWSEQLSSKNKIYYYNCTTEVSQWQKPEEWTLLEVPKQELIEQYHRRERGHEKEGHAIKRAYPVNNSGSNHQHSAVDTQYSNSRSGSTTTNAVGSLHKVTSTQQRYPPTVSSSMQSSHRPSSGGVSPKRLRYDSSGSVDTGSNHQYSSSNNHSCSQQQGSARVFPKTMPHSVSSTSNSLSASYNQHSSGTNISSNVIGSTSSRPREGGNYRTSGNHHLSHLHNPNSLGSMLAARAHSQQKPSNPLSGSSSSHLSASNNPHLEDMDISPGSSPLSGGSCSPQPQPDISQQHRKRSPIDNKQAGPQRRVQPVQTPNASSLSSVTRHQTASSSLPVRQLLDTLNDSLARNQSGNTNFVNSSSSSRQYASTNSSANPALSTSQFLINNVSQQLMYNRQVSTSAAPPSSASLQQNQGNYSRSFSTTGIGSTQPSQGNNNNNSAIITSLINSLSNNSQSQNKHPVTINNKVETSQPSGHSSNSNRHLEDLVSRLESQLSRDNQQHSQSLHINTSTHDSAPSNQHQATMSPASLHPRHQQHSNQLPARPSPLLDKKVASTHHSLMPRSNDQNSELIRLLSDILKNPSILQQPGKENSYKSMITLLQKYLEDLKSRNPNASSPSVSATIQRAGASPSIINKIPQSNGCHLGVNSGNNIDSHSTVKPHSFPSTLGVESGSAVSLTSNVSRGNSHESNSSCPVLPPTSSPYQQNSAHQTPVPSVLDSISIMQYLDSVPLSRFKDPSAERLEHEAQMESQKFDKLQTVLYGELSCELKKLRALVRIGEAKTAVQQKKKDMLEELMESIESRKLPPSFSFKAT